jgi:hypothetical protein
LIRQGSSRLEEVDRFYVCHVADNVDAPLRQEIVDEQDVAVRVIYVQLASLGNILHKACGEALQPLYVPGLRRDHYRAIGRPIDRQTAANFSARGIVGVPDARSIARPNKQLAVAGKVHALVVAIRNDCSRGDRSRTGVDHVQATTKRGSGGLSRATIVRC